ncbi:hypothetical protein D9M71_480870 [compost metagenome]
MGNQDIAAPKRALLGLHVLRDGQRLVDCLFQLVEGVDVCLFPLRRFLAGEAHAEEGEAIAGHAEVRLPLVVRARSGTLRKIAECEFGGAVQASHALQNIVVALAEVGSDVKAGGGRLSVDQFNGDRCNGGDGFHGVSPTILTVTTIPRPNGRVEPCGLAYRSLAPATLASAHTAHP